MQQTPKTGGRYKRHADGQILPVGKAPAKPSTTRKRATGKKPTRRRGSTSKTTPQGGE